jgi:hypothetical protein
MRIPMLRYTLSFVLLVLLANSVFAGTVYEITSNEKGKAVTYEVNFGGGQLFHQHTAFDPVSKKFVYLQWQRDQKAPKPVGAIWEHETGKTLELYEFPGVKHPLPVIPSLEAMKVCPLTGDRNFRSRPLIAVD